MYSKRGLTDGFRRIDTDHKGSLSGSELMQFFMNDGTPQPWPPHPEPWPPPKMRPRPKLCAPS